MKTFRVAYPAREAPSSRFFTIPVQYMFCSGLKTFYWKQLEKFSRYCVRTVYGNSNGFEVKVGMHQGSALCPLLFVMVMEALSREFRVALPWELLYADDLVVIAETEEDLIKRLNEWRISWRTEA